MGRDCGCSKSEQVDALLDPSLYALRVYTAQNHDDLSQSVGFCSWKQRKIYMRQTGTESLGVKIIYYRITESGVEVDWSITTSAPDTIINLQQLSCLTGS